MSFRDHFDGSLDARWTALQSGPGGAVTVTDSYVQLASPATGDGAAVYYNTKIDKSKSQLWLFASNHISVANGHRDLYLWNSASAPTLIAFSETAARVRVSAGLSGANVGLTAAYWDGSHARQEWNGSTNVWSSSSAQSIPFGSWALDHYGIIGLEIDGPNSRWRVHIWTKIGGTTAQAGLVQQVLTDWVNWSSLEATDDLWLILGAPFNTAAAWGTIRYEYVELHDGPQHHAWVNGKNTSSGTYDIRHVWGYEDADGGVSVFVPEDRSTVALAVGGAGTWDEISVKDPWVVQDGATYYMFYNGDGASTNFQIGLATASSPNGPWTKDAGNPIVAQGTGTEAHVQLPRVVKDTAEADSNKRWKMLYTGVQTSPSLEFNGFYATAPNATGTWTKQGQVLALTSRHIPYWDGSQWVVFGADENPATDNGVIVATGPALDDLTNQGNVIPDDAGTGQDITANITASRTISVSDSSGFVKDARAVIDQDATSDNFTEVTVRKVVNSTTIETYEQLTGYTTTSPAAFIAPEDAFVVIDCTDLVKFGSTYWMYTGRLNPVDAHASFAAFYEAGGIHKSSSLTSGWTFHRQRGSSATRNNFGHLRSHENLTTVHQPVHAAASLPPAPHPMRHLLVR